MSGLPIEVSMLSGLLPGCILYGVHIVTFGNAVRVLLFRKRRAARRPYLIVATFLFMLFGTLFVAFSFQYVLDAYGWVGGRGGKSLPQQRSIFVPDLLTFQLASQVLTGDAMLIYRCFVLHQRNWLVVVLPILCWLGTAGLGIFCVYDAATLKVDKMVGDTQLEPIIILALSLTLTINIFCTCMIVYKILRMRRRVLDILPGNIKPKLPYARVITIIVESAAMYTAFAVLMFVLELLRSNIAYMVYQTTVQIVGIAFNVITIRVDQGESVETELPTTMSRTGELHFASACMTVDEEAQGSAGRGADPMLPRFLCDGLATSSNSEVADIIVVKDSCEINIALSPR
ncbi:hypothetical protein FA95DRAFT_1608276 [Auriscalpium vulgare]|uniref:Uncharacterized protein n=1 Tax=Auriscalpium vulgare TaxID=40419 RepID=A0ACB8RKQ6_9AGAM|nr:hypothetical protein FA95DRAFT_1608276 [Auriscalpium vulgare]